METNDFAVRLRVKKYQYEKRWSLEKYDKRTKTSRELARFADASVWEKCEPHVVLVADANGERDAVLEAVLRHHQTAIRAAKSAFLDRYQLDENALCFLDPTDELRTVDAGLLAA